MQSSPFASWKKRGTRCQEPANGATRGTGPGMGVAESGIVRARAMRATYSTGCCGIWPPAHSGAICQSDTALGSLCDRFSLWRRDATLKPRLNRRQVQPDAQGRIDRDLIGNGGSALRANQAPAEARKKALQRAGRSCTVMLARRLFHHTAPAQGEIPALVAGRSEKSERNRRRRQLLNKARRLPTLRRANWAHRYRSRHAPRDALA